MEPHLIDQMLKKCADQLPEKIALIDHGKSITYGELFERAKRFCDALAVARHHQGEHVGIYLDKSLEQITSMFGVWLAGGVVVLMSPVLKKAQISHIINNCQIRTLVTSEKKIKVLPDLSEFAHVRRGIVFGSDSVSESEKIIRTDTVLKNFRPKVPAVNINTEDTSHIFYTSGSTGLPKGVVVSHRNGIDGARIVSLYTKLSKEDRILGVLPLNFDYGFNQLMNSVYLGATYILHNFSLPSALLSDLENEKGTVLAGMPPIWTKLFNPKLCDLSKPPNLSHLRVVTNSGGKMPIPILKKMKTLFSNADIYLMYGLTEAFRSTFLDPSEIDKRPNSIGKAIPNVRVYVIDEKGKECAPNEEGELIHTGALISKGYWNDPEATARVFRPNPILDKGKEGSGLAVYSGDLVKKDKEGFLYFVGRKDHQMKISGYRVSPIEIEEMVSSIDGVSACVACGIEEETDTALVVFVTLDNPTVSESDILALCHQKAPFYMVPRRVILLSEFPLTANGKIDRVALMKNCQ